MLERFNKLINKNNNSLKINLKDPSAENQLKVATGVILLEMAGRDDDFDPIEVKTVFRAMEQAFQLDSEQVKHILENSQEMLCSKEQLSKVIEEINQHFSKEDRTKILSMAWQVVMADGQVDKKESRFFEQMRNRLHLTEEEAESIKQSVQG